MSVAAGAFLLTLHIFTSSHLHRPCVCLQTLQTLRSDGRGRTQNLRTGDALRHPPGYEVSQCAYRSEIFRHPSIPCPSPELGASPPDGMPVRYRTPSTIVVPLAKKALALTQPVGGREDQDVKCGGKSQKQPNIRFRFWPFRPALHRRRLWICQFPYLRTRCASMLSTTPTAAPTINGTNFGGCVCSKSIARIGEACVMSRRGLMTSSLTAT